MKEIPYIVFESEMARLERIIKKQFVLIIVAVVFLVGTNACWLWYENQFIDEVTVTQENDDGYNNYVDGDGTITN
jgi:hypothetical protein